MSARAALRVVCAISQSERGTSPYALNAFRAILASASFAVARPEDIQKLKDAGISAAGIAYRHYDTVSAAVGDGLQFNAPDAELNLGAAEGCAGETAVHASSVVSTIFGSAKTAALVARAALSEKFIDGAFEEHPAAKQAFEAVSIDARLDTTALMSRPVWANRVAPDGLAALHADLLATLAKGGPSTFWHRWYSAMWDGTFRDWPLALEVAKTSDEFWEGKDALEKVADEIGEIEAQFARKEREDYSIQRPPSAAEVATVRQRAEMNRDALAVSTAGLLDQLSTFRETVRGSNTLNTATRDELLEFIDGLSGSLEQLLQNLPMPGTTLDNDEAHRLAVWTKEYWQFLKVKMSVYCAPENVAEATLPTSIVLGCSVIGASLGYPIAGPIVGGLITQTLKPSDAAKALLKSESSKSGNEPTDGQDGAG